MPFPSLYKAACLSRSWFYKFPLPGLSVRSPSLSLQQEIASVSSQWPVFCPNYLSKDRILGFDKCTNQWRSIFTSSYGPLASWESVESVTCCGSLICVISMLPNDEYDVFVANVLTRCWRKLPKYQLPVETEDGGTVRSSVQVRLLPLGADGYRLLIVHKFSRNNWVEIAIYDSRERTWTVKEPTELYLDCFFRNSALWKEKIYFLSQNFTGQPVQMRVLNIEENSWTAVPHDFGGDEIIDGAVLSCREKVILAIWIATDPMHGINNGVSRPYTAKGSIKIFELLPDVPSLRHVVTGPPTRMWGVGRSRRGPVRSLYTLNRTEPDQKQEVGT